LRAAGPAGRRPPSHLHVARTSTIPEEPTPSDRSRQGRRLRRPAPACEVARPCAGACPVAGGRCRGGRHQGGPMRLNRLARSWDRLGESDPLWAILYDPSKKGNRWGTEEFYETGVDEVSAAMRYIES